MSLEKNRINQDCAARRTSEDCALNPRECNFCIDGSRQYCTGRLQTTLGCTDELYTSVRYNPDGCLTSGRDAESPLPSPTPRPTPVADPEACPAAAITEFGTSTCALNPTEAACDAAVGCNWCAGTAAMGGMAMCSAELPSVTEPCVLVPNSGQYIGPDGCFIESGSATASPLPSTSPVPTPVPSPSDGVPACASQVMTDVLTCYALDETTCAVIPNTCATYDDRESGTVKCGIATPPENACLVTGMSLVVDTNGRVTAAGTTDLPTPPTGTCTTEELLALAATECVSAVTEATCPASCTWCPIDPSLETTTAQAGSCLGSTTFSCTTVATSGQMIEFVNSCAKVVEDEDATPLPSPSNSPLPSPSPSPVPDPIAVCTEEDMTLMEDSECLLATTARTCNAIPKCNWCNPSFADEIGDQTDYGCVGRPTQQCYTVDGSVTTTFTEDGCPVNNQVPDLPYPYNGGSGSGDDDNEYPVCDAESIASMANRQCLFATTATCETIDGCSLCGSQCKGIPINGKCRSYTFNGDVVYTSAEGCSVEIATPEADPVRTCTALDTSHIQTAVESAGCEDFTTEEQCSRQPSSSGCNWCKTNAFGANFEACIGTWGDVCKQAGVVFPADSCPVLEDNYRPKEDEDIDDENDDEPEAPDDTPVIPAPPTGGVVAEMAATFNAEIIITTEMDSGNSVPYETGLPFPYEESASASADGRKRAQATAASLATLFGASGSRAAFSSLAKQMHAAKAHLRQGMMPTLDGYFYFDATRRRTRLRVSAPAYDVEADSISIYSERKVYAKEADSCACMVLEEEFPPMHLITAGTVMSRDEQVAGKVTTWVQLSMTGLTINWYVVEEDGKSVPVRIAVEAGESAFALKLNFDFQSFEEGVDDDDFKPDECFEDDETCKAFDERGTPKAEGDCPLNPPDGCQCASKNIDLDYCDMIDYPVSDYVSFAQNEMLAKRAVDAELWTQMVATAAAAGMSLDTDAVADMDLSEYAVDAECERALKAYYCGSFFPRCAQGSMDLPLCRSQCPSCSCPAFNLCSADLGDSDCTTMGDNYCIGNENFGPSMADLDLEDTSFDLSDVMNAASGATNGIPLDSISLDVTAAGSTVVLVQVGFATDAFDSDTQLVVGAVDEEVLALAKKPSRWADAGEEFFGSAVISVTAGGRQPRSPVKLSFSVSASVSADLELYCLGTIDTESATWTCVDDGLKVDETTGKVSGETPHFSDFAVVLNENAPMPSSNKEEKSGSSTGAIVGGTIGALVIIGAIVGAVFFMKARSGRPAAQPTGNITANESASAAPPAPAAAPVEMAPMPSYDSQQSTQV